MSVLAKSIPTHNTTSVTHAVKPNLRPAGADDAGDFAQVLRRHDAESDTTEPILASDDNEKIGNEDAEDEEATEPAADGTGEQEAKGAEDAEDARGETANAGTGGKDAADAPRTDDASGRIAPPPARVETEQASEELAAPVSKLDLLRNKGDQAKLSIRGLVRAARSQAVPDLTTVAVQTRLGKIDPGGAGDATHPIEAQRAGDGVRPDVVRPPAQSVGDADRSPLDALSDRPPSGDSEKEAAVVRRFGAQRPETRDEPVKTDASQGGVDAQQLRSTRADAAGTLKVSEPRPTPVRQDAWASIGRMSVSNAPKGEGTLTVRAVSGIEAGGARQGVEAGGSRPAAASRASVGDAGTLRAKTIAQVQRGLASLMRSKDSEMTLRLTPEHLGELRIEIKRDGERLAVRLRTSSAEATDLLRSGSADLTRALQSKGVRVEEMHIEHEPGLQQGSADAGGQGGRSEGDGQRHSGHGHRVGVEPMRGTSPVTPDSQEPLTGRDGATIWTELGLDAIA